MHLTFHPLAEFRVLVADRFVCSVMIEVSGNPSHRQ